MMRASFMRSLHTHHDSTVHLWIKTSVGVRVRPFLDVAISLNDIAYLRPS